MNNNIQKKSILCVEDCDQTLNELCELMGDISDTIYKASNGKDALDVYHQTQPDAIITDIEMPVMNGLKLIENIRKTDKKTPIIILSAYSDTNYLLNAANLNIQGYLLKPLSIKNLNKMINTLEEHLYTKNIFNLKDEYFYDMTNATITHKTTVSRLNKKEKLLMNLFIKNKNTLLTYEQIEYEVWDVENENMSNSALRTLIKTLRKKLPLKSIENVTKEGYRFLV